jgi:hypothetical protein
MKDNKPIRTEKRSNPTTGGMADIDEMAKIWIELVLKQVRKSPVVSFKNSPYNNVIGLLNSK